MGEQDWAQVVETATRAPSIHNTQPWIFVAGPDRLDVFLDPARVLRVIDPSRRQQVLSCGTAVEFAVVALRATGAAVAVELLPDAGSPDHLAALRVTGEREVTEEDRAGLAAVAGRHTAREAFVARAVPAELVEELAGATRGTGVWIKQITREEEEVATAFLVSRAEELEQRDPEYLAELQHWVRSDPDAVDGVPLAALPEGDPATRPSNWLVRDFVAGQHERRTFRPPENPDAPAPEVERPTVLLLGTGNDDRAAWLDTGRALARLLLRATRAGVAASPLTQALDWPATRQQLRNRLHLLGHPQMMLRMGYPADGDGAGVVSGRRPVGEVLRFVP